MDKKRKYNVEFAGLSLGTHHFDFDITQNFFDMFDFDQDFANPNIKVDLEFIKKANFLELFLHSKGEVEVTCDITDEPYTEPVEGDLHLVVKFGEEFNTDDDEIWEIPEGEHQINIAQLIYEMILLSIPKKRIHPNPQSEEAKKALKILDKYAVGSKREIDGEETADPRWNKLKNLLKN